MATNVVNKYKQPYDVYIGRGSKWGNPFTHIPTGTKAEFVVGSREEAVEAYEKWLLEGTGQYLLGDIHELKDKTLGCFCKPKSCHGDVLARLADNLNN